MCDVAEQIRGVSYKQEDVLDGPGEDAIGILRANNISDGIVSFKELIFVKRDKVMQKQMLRKGDILICASSGSKHLVGKAAQIESDCEYSFGAFCKVVRPLKINTLFLGMYFQSNFYRRYISGVSQGANINNIKNEHIDTIKIRGYSEAEQVKIANLLQMIINIIRLYKEQVIAFDELIKSRFVELFGDPIHNEKGWKTSTIEHACDEIYGGGTPSKSHPEYYENGNIPWVSSKDMKTDVLYDSQIHINQLGVNNSTAKIVPANSVIMVIRSGILKHTLPVAINAVPITVNQDLKVFIPNKNILTRFLAIQLKLHEKDILSGVRAVTADNIEFNSLKQRTIIVPPLEIQQQFVDFIEQIDKSKFATQKSLTETQQLFDSLMQKYFG